MSVERDRIADVYADYATGGASMRWSTENAGYRNLVIDRNTQFAAEIKAAAIGHLAPNVLDLGCGAGSDLGLIHDAVPDDSKLIGVELRFDALRLAGDEFSDSWGLINADATRLPFPDACFDIVVMATVLSSILDESIRIAVAAEIRRVLAPGGAIVIYDMRVSNPSNRHLRSVGGRSLGRLFPDFKQTFRSLTLIPQLTRRLPNRIAAPAYRLLSRLPILRSHRISTLKDVQAAITVMHVTSAHPPTDPRIFVKECQTLVAAGYNVSLAAPGARTGVQNGVELIELPLRVGRRQRFTRAAGDVNRVVRARRPDVVHFHDPDLLLIALLWRARGRLVVYDAHESLRKDMARKPYLRPWQSRLLGPVIGWTESTIARRLTHVIAATPAIADQWSFDTTVIANYPVLEEWSTIDSSWSSYERRPDRGCYVGVVHSERCTDVMIAATREAFERWEISLSIAGPTDEDLPSGPGVEYLGALSRTDVAGLLAMCRFGVVLFQPNPNVTDALPTKIMEYMAAGLPMIVSRSLHVGSGVVTEVGCGVIVDHDQPSQVAAAMNQLITDPEAAWEMGQRGKQAVSERYSWSSEAHRLVQTYEHKIVKAKRSQR